MSGGTISAEAKPTRRSDLRLQHVDGRRVLIIDGELYQLNETAELVWSLCTGENTLEQIATQVAQDYHVDQRQAHADLSELFGELEAIGAIVLST